MTRGELLYDISDLPQDGYKTLHKILSDHDAEQRAVIDTLNELVNAKETRCCEYQAEIERLKAQLAESEKAAYDVAGTIEGLKAQLAGWKELEGKDIYQQYANCRATVKALQAQLATAKGERDELMTNLESCKGNELAAQNEILQQELDRLRRADKKRVFKVATEQQKDAL